MESNIREIYRTFCREGKLLEARKILRFLTQGSYTFWLSDEDWNCCMALQDIGCKSRIDIRQGNWERFLP